MKTLLNNRAITRIQGILIVIILLVVAGIGIYSTLPSPGPGPTPSVTISTSQAGQTLFIATEDPPPGLDPAVDMDTPGSVIESTAVETLYVLKRGTTEPIPCLATSYDVDADATVWTFSLRQGVKFHDGTPFNATAVKYSFERIVAINKGPADFWKVLKMVEVLDTYTVRITLTQPFPAFISMISGPQIAGIVSPSSEKMNEVNGDWGEEWNHKHVIGTGPYMFVEWKEGEYLKFVKFQDYWRGWTNTNNNIDTIMYVQTSDPAQRKIAIQSGRVQIVTDLLPVDVHELTNTAGYTVVNGHTLSTSYLYLNNLKGPTTNINVRKAIAYAIDYNALTDTIMSGFATRAQGPISTMYSQHNNSIPIIQQDLEKAKGYLAAAGYKPGQLTLQVWYNTGVAWKADTATLIQSNLRDIGINVDIHSTDWPTISQMLADKTQFPDMIVAYETNEFADPSNILGLIWYSYGLRNHGYTNPVVDDLLLRAGRETDPQKATTLYQEAQSIIANDFPDVPLFELTYSVIMKNTVHGYVPVPTNFPYYNFYDMYVTTG